MILNGTGKASGLLQSEMEGRSRSSYEGMLALTRETRVKFGHAFMMDTGSSTGEIIGHSKVCCIDNYERVLTFPRLSMLFPSAINDHLELLPLRTTILSYSIRELRTSTIRSVP